MPVLLFINKDTKTSLLCNPNREHNSSLYFNPHLKMSYRKTAWLIDDDELCNYLTANILESNNFCSETRFFTHAQKALAELETSVKKGEFPDFIFLDLNMPVLDGWGFLQAYQNFPEEVKENCSLFILSSSVDEDDINKSKLYEDVRDFISKPFNKMKLEVVKFQTED